MNEFLARQVRGITTAVETTGSRLLGNAILALLAALALAAGVAFLGAALFLEISMLLGALYAALVVGGAFLVIALIIFIILKVRRPRAVKAAAAKPSPAEIEKAARQAALAANIDETVAPVLAALHDANLKPEEFALRLASQITKQTGALGLIAVATAGGFIAARRAFGARK